MTNPKPKCGFTLIEILVVIAIISIFSSIGYFTYDKSLIIARDARRKQDLTQIKTALLSYHQDHAAYPPASPTQYSFVSDSAPSPDPNAWIPELSGYMPQIPKDPKQAGIITGLANLFNRIGGAPKAIEREFVQKPQPEVAGAATTWSMIYDTDETTILSLAYDSTNSVIYAGTLKNGRGTIYRCATYTRYSCQNPIGWSIPFSSTSENEIDSLVFDSAHSVIYAGAGSGKIYRCDTTSTSCNSQTNWTTAFSGDSNSDQILSLVFDSAHNVIYAGSGKFWGSGHASGFIYRCDTSTSDNCASSTDWRTAYASPGEIDISSLAFDSAHNVIYAGTALNGTINRCDTSTGCSLQANWTTVYSNFNDLEIYSLAFDSVNNVMYAGTGSGKIHRCDTSTGNHCTLATDWSTPYSSSTLENFYSLAFDPANQIIYAGGAWNATVYRCDASTGNHCNSSTDWSTSYTPADYGFNSLVYDSKNRIVYGGTSTGGRIHRGLLPFPTPTPLPSPSPDLIITDFHLTDSSGNTKTVFQPNEAIYPSVTIKNNGTGTTAGSFYVSTYSNQPNSVPSGTQPDKNVYVTETNSIAAGASMTYAKGDPHWSGTGGDHWTMTTAADGLTARVFVDSFNSITETDETNNQQTQTYLIAVPQPTPIPTPNPRTPPCSYNGSDGSGGYGDVTGDGNVFSDDSTLIANYVVNSAQYPLSNLQKILADVDNSDPINHIPSMADARLVAQYSQGSISNFAVCASASPQPSPNPNPTPPPPTSCEGKSNVYCYVLSLDRSSFVLWAQLENTSDPEIYNKPNAACNLSPPNNPTLGHPSLNYCVKSPT